MDVMAILNSLIQGGPTVVFIIMGGVMWLQYYVILELKKDLDALSFEFKQFQILYASERVLKTDLDEIKDMIKDYNMLISRMFERFDSHVAHCGRDCRAAREGGDCAANRR
ncbi:MAG: hypothetical protein HQL90_08235 [Magnetococcales bacterium]|nr:hypothetical protein [Magnetococcales bacterium]